MEKHTATKMTVAQLPLNATSEIGTMLYTIQNMGTNLIEIIRRDATKIKKEIGDMISVMDVTPTDASYISDAYSGLSKYLSEAEDAYHEMGRFPSLQIEGASYGQPGWLDHSAKHLSKMANSHALILGCRETVQKIKKSYNK